MSFGPLAEIHLVGTAKALDLGNAYAKPVVNQIKLLPWECSANVKIGEILCEPELRDGQKIEENPRYLARKQLQTLEAMGFQLMSAYEHEFLVTKAGKPLYESRQYCSTVKLMEVKDFILDLEKNMWQCGINVESLHSEAAPARFEYTFTPKYGIQVPDDMFLFRRAAKEIAVKYGLEVTFMAKPFAAGVCTGHFNHSLWSIENNTNAFYDKDSQLSQLGRYWVGGIIKHMKALTAIYCPTPNCYRILHSPRCGDRTDWGFSSRNFSLRVTSNSASATYVENRIPSSSANVYLVMAATIAAGIDGIKNQTEPPPEGKCPDSDILPSNLAEALEALESDEVLADSLGPTFMACFLYEKRKVEVDKFGKHDINNSVPSELEAERAEYFELL